MAPYFLVRSMIRHSGLSRVYKCGPDRLRKHHGKTGTGGEMCISTKYPPYRIRAIYIANGRFEGFKRQRGRSEGGEGRRKSSFFLISLGKDPSQGSVIPWDPSEFQCVLVLFARLVAMELTNGVRSARNKHLDPKGRTAFCRSITISYIAMG